MSKAEIYTYDKVIGKVFSRVERGKEDTSHEESILFWVGDEEKPRYKLYHDQDCCEHVYIESVVGDLQDLVGAPILLAEVVYKDDTKKDADDCYNESATWSFFKFATRKGYVDIRFHGSSNGYYSETATLGELVERNEWDYYQ